MTDMLGQYPPTMAHSAAKISLILLLVIVCFSGSTRSYSPLPNQSKGLELRGGDQNDSSPDGFEILEETIAYSGWRTLIQRTVRMRNGKIVNFDIVGQKDAAGAVLIFAWDSKTKTATLVREYMPGSNKILYGIAAGLIEAKHGDKPEVAAEHELEEECHLTGGTWISLSSQPSSMDKYSLSEIFAFLVLDAEREANPKPLDDEEDIEIVKGVTIPEILQLIASGEMNLVGGWGCLLAIEKLRELGEYP